MLRLDDYHKEDCSIIEGRCYEKGKLRVFAAAEFGANNMGKIVLPFYPLEGSM